MTEEMPHLTFERKAVDYKDEAGHNLSRDVYYVHIRQRGGKDEVTKIAEEWIEDLRVKAATRSDFDENAIQYNQWAEKARLIFEAFKKGEEAPMEGRRLRDLMAFSPAEVKNCEQVQLYTLEQLAQATEVAIGFLGPGARGLKLKAQKMIEEYESGKVAEENAALRLRLDELEQETIKLRKIVENQAMEFPQMDIQSMVANAVAVAMAQVPRGPGRPPKAA